ncbi:hypothetical protein KX928_01855 [Roseobacter sp. YSTF-M11]|uniref:Type I secretion target repeat protein n=1 Tax=Roseobacter insulae TaxID=2859783 RepID=A0A9X1FRS8_9RHOB|nr:hypothetical protein [Roseobacter insulae]MBW4706520.1 hypothetical protein [Roseobacter insulae]
MLWMAGLMGLVGVGAASLVAIKPDEIEDEHEDGALEDDGYTADTIDLFDQFDTLDVSQILGGDADEVITGTSDTDFIEGGEGDDRIDGEGGSDLIFGGIGSDILNGIVDDPDYAGITDTDASDYLNGGDGDDLLILGANDIAVSGAGDDEFLLGDWITEGKGVEILDYEPAHDSLMLVWDDTSATADEPDVSVNPDPDDPEVMHISMNGVSVAEIYGDTELSVADLTLIPLSSAEAIGLEPV